MMPALARGQGKTIIRWGEQLPATHPQVQMLERIAKDVAADTKKLSTTDAFTTPMEVTGPIQLVLHIASSAPDTDFLAKVCQQWEASCQAARDAGIPVANIRIGVVLSPDGGALAKMLTPFKLGLGGKLGSGDQYMSWVALDDLVGAIVYLLGRDEPVVGPVNVVAPHPATNLGFTKTLGRVLGRVHGVVGVAHAGAPDWSTARSLALSRPMNFESVIRLL